MKSSLYFVRHAHSAYTPEELERPLSVQGMEDAKFVTECLKQEKIDFIVSSPYKRAIQTVEGISNYCGKKIEIYNDLRERTLSLEPVSDFKHAITKLWEDNHFSWEGGESNIVAQRRGVAITLHLLEKYEGKNIVIGSHGNLMVLIMNYFDKKYDIQFWNNLAMPDIYKLDFEAKELVEVTRIWRDSTTISSR
ncbi:histidine phosphatase family protein [Psychrobacillus vulpis]|uniref:histidine phosphatase family protein n=1 Tax=Psychrobacillus vulpis TaxID=2325572 RepID=UPI001F0F8B4C|nr:histidine phosphatase family protein [Psychrobacillus vulpis]